MNLPAHKVSYLMKEAEKKFKASWDYAKSVYKTAGSLKPFNRAVEELERDLNEIREFAGLKGETKLPKLKDSSPVGIRLLERDISKEFFNFQLELLERTKKEETEEEDLGLGL